MTRAYVFFPALLLLAAGLIGVSLLPVWRPAPRGAVGFAEPGRIDVSGPALNRLEIGPGAAVKFEGQGGRRSAIASAYTPQTSGATRENAAYLPVSESAAYQLAGARIRIRVLARPDRRRPTARFALGYRAGPDGVGGWMDFAPEPGADFTWYATEYEVPAQHAERDTLSDFVAIWADQDGLGRALEIRAIVVERLG
ncbi:MAG: hypothetical protein ACFB2Z_09545 [Maricaulaceae bacterium]